MLERNGSSGRTRTYNPPVNSLVALRRFNNLAAQMTTHEGTQTRTMCAYVPLIWPTSSIVSLIDTTTADGTKPSLVDTWRDWWFEEGHYRAGR